MELSHLFNISSLLEVLQCDDENIVVETLGELQKLASVLFLHGITLLRPQNSHISVSTIQEIIARKALWALYWIIQRNPSSLTLLPSPIFPSSSPHHKYSGLSFLAALTKKLRKVFSKFQTALPTDPSHLQKYIELIKDDPFKITRSISFCYYSFPIPVLLFRATPRIEVDSEIVRDLILFVKEALPTILTNISTIDTLIASLPSDSSPTTPLVSGVDTQMTDSLKELRDACAVFIGNEWKFFANLTINITDPHKSSFQTILLDDPSFADLIFNSLKITHRDIRTTTIMTITNNIIYYPKMREQFMTANLVGRMFETVDFVSLPLSKSNTHFHLTKFIFFMCNSIGGHGETLFNKYPLIRVSVFEPAKHFIKFIFRNSDKLILNEEYTAEQEYQLCLIHNHAKNLELRSDEHDADFVSELVKWEVRTMVEMENEEPFQKVFRSMLNRTQEWNRDKRERQKRREVLLREEGWDDAFELRVVGIGVDTNFHVRIVSNLFRLVLTLNANSI
ncbi:hypothetical protein BLNAU_11454 [Blattamonas nauphoetae]|uniref:Uncharacterized protein n=1 Tax=Blattamonas nauphoetae TaxID=2049346 RepID=A0ABQ9XSK0_9EUKA|nr:hypothetical protein BLNAU_11454 [Blattamonas nauphoetae]